MIKWLRDRFDLMLNGYTAEDVVSLLQKMTPEAIVSGKGITLTARETKAFIEQQSMQPDKLRKLLFTTWDQNYLKKQSAPTINE